MMQVTFEVIVAAVVGTADTRSTYNSISIPCRPIDQSTHRKRRRRPVFVWKFSQHFSSFIRILRASSGGFIPYILQIFTARCTRVQSAVLRSHVVCLSVCLSMTLVNC